MPTIRTLRLDRELAPQAPVAVARGEAFQVDAERDHGRPLLRDRLARQPRLAVEVRGEDDERSRRPREPPERSAECVVRRTQLGRVVRDDHRAPKGARGEQRRRVDVGDVHEIGPRRAERRRIGTRRTQRVRVALDRQRDDVSVELAQRL